MKHLPSMAKFSDNVEFVAFCDILEDRAKEAAEKYGVSDAKVFTDYKQMLENSNLDVVHVCTPNAMHCEISCAALEAGNHVMCEKPMAITASDALKMVNTAKKTGKMLTIGYQNRFRDDSLYLKKLADAGDLGEIYYGKAHAIRRRGVPTWGVFLDKSLQGGGPLIDIGTHALDLTLWMMENYKPRTVLGASFEKLGRLLNPDEQGNGKPWDNKNFEVEDSAVGLVIMENGAAISIEASWALNTLDPRYAKTTLCGTKGGADMDDGVRFNHVSRGEPVVTAFGSNYAPGRDLLSFGELGQREAQSWISALEGKSEVVVKPDQAYAVTQILEAIYQSSEQKKAIELV